MIEIRVRGEKNPSSDSIYCNCSCWMSASVAADWSGWQVGGCGCACPSIFAESEMQTTFSF